MCYLQPFDCRYFETHTSVIHTFGHYYYYYYYKYYYYYIIIIIVINIIIIIIIIVLPNEASLLRF